MVVQRLYGNFVWQRIEREMQHIARRDIFTVFHFRAIDQHAAEFDVFLRQGAGFEKTGGPQPFVEPHCLPVFHDLPFVILKARV